MTYSGPPYWPSEYDDDWCPGQDLNVDMESCKDCPFLGTGSCGMSSPEICPECHQVALEFDPGEVWDYEDGPESPPVWHCSSCGYEKDAR